MEDLSIKHRLEVTLLRAKNKRYVAFIAMLSSDGFIIGRDVLAGHGTTDLFASWQRLMNSNADMLRFFDLVPVCRPGLDQLQDETRKAWGARIISTLPSDESARPVRPPWESSQPDGVKA